MDRTRVLELARFLFLVNGEPSEFGPEIGCLVGLLLLGVRQACSSISGVLLCA
jgi:hypothetical protein